MNYLVKYSLKIENLFYIYMTNLVDKTNLNFELPLFDECDWRFKTFKNPNAKIRLATTFSGIGAIEQAFKRLELNHCIVFAGDIDPHVKKVI